MSRPSDMSHWLAANTVPSEGMTMQASDQPQQPVDEELATDTLMALATMLDTTGCPAMTVTEASDEGVSLTLHFSADRARKLIAAALSPSRPSGEPTAEFRAALAQITEHYPPSTTAGRIAADAFAKASLDHTRAKDELARSKPPKGQPPTYYARLRELVAAERYQEALDLMRMPIPDTREPTRKE